MRSADPATHRYQIKALIHNTEGLLPGMFGRAAFEIGMEPKTLIPAAALVKNGGIEGVYEYDESTGTAIFRWLRLGAQTTDGIQVLAGLENVQKIVLPLDTTLTNGATIEIERGLP